MKNANTPYIIVGKIGAPYGVRGWFKVHSYTEFGASILEYRPWYLSQANDQWSSAQIENGKIHGNGIIAKLVGINSPEEARLLTGKTIAIARSQLPVLKKDEFYWSDLEGLTVVNKEGQTLGTVSYLIETGANDVLIIKNGDKEHAIPYLPGKVVVNVDLEKQQITVDWELI